MASKWYKKSAQQGNTAGKINASRAMQVREHAKIHHIVFTAQPNWRPLCGGVLSWNRGPSLS
jgi:TPR repeat protein